MSTVLRLLRLAALLSGCALFGSACVRLDEPSLYRCGSDAECAAGEKCGLVQSGPGAFQKACVARDSCLIDDFECDSNRRCVQQRCVVVSQPQPLGASCAQGTDCVTGLCCQRATGSVCTSSCRGLGEICSNGEECQSSVCCLADNGIRSCAPHACPAISVNLVGSPCKTSSDCVDGNCRDATFCTKTCSQDSDCGESTWGSSTACDGVGTKLCYTTCTANGDCTAHVPGTTCVEGVSSGKKICVAAK